MTCCDVMKCDMMLYVFVIWLYLYGETPLHFASGYDHVAVAELLMRRGANINIQDEVSILLR